MVDHILIVESEEHVARCLSVSLGPTVNSLCIWRKNTSRNVLAWVCCKASDWL